MQCHAVYPVGYQIIKFNGKYNYGITSDLHCLLSSPMHHIQATPEQPEGVLLGLPYTGMMHLAMWLKKAPLVSHNYSYTQGIIIPTRLW